MGNLKLLFLRHQEVEKLNLHSNLLVFWRYIIIKVKLRIYGGQEKNMSTETSYLTDFLMRPWLLYIGRGSSTVLWKVFVCCLALPRKLNESVITGKKTDQRLHWIQVLKIWGFPDKLFILT